MPIITKQPQGGSFCLGIIDLLTVTDVPVIGEDGEELLSKGRIKEERHSFSVEGMGKRFIEERADERGL